MRGVTGSCGFLGVPKCGLSPSAEKANSERLVFPSATMPAADRLATIGASFSFGGTSAKSADPAVVRSPAMSTRSFQAMGTPSSGPAARPSRRRLRLASASFSARSRVTTMNDRFAIPLDPIEEEFRNLDRVKVAFSGVIEPSDLRGGALFEIVDHVSVGFRLAVRLEASGTSASARCRIANARPRPPQAIRLCYTCMKKSNSEACRRRRRSWEFSSFGLHHGRCCGIDRAGPCRRPISPERRREARRLYGLPLGGDRRHGPAGQIRPPNAPAS